jgi:hypothetical protein
MGIFKIAPGALRNRPIVELFRGFQNKFTFLNTLLIHFSRTFDPKGVKTRLKVIFENSLWAKTMNF